jgi:hypothetical protein
MDKEYKQPAIPTCIYHKDLYQMVKEIHEGLLGNEDHPGIFERVRSLEGTKKVLIAALAAGGVSFLEFTFLIVKDIIHP